MCDVNFEPTLEGLCSCVPHYYATSPTVCQECSLTCYECSILSTNCTSCPASSHRTLIGETCPCDLGYVHSGVVICQPCSTYLVGCVSCKSTSICTACQATGNFQLSTTNHNCSCISNYYQTATNTCSLCSFRCQECSKIVSNCTSCPISSHRILLGNACPCDTGYLDTGFQVCEACEGLI